MKSVLLIDDDDAFRALIIPGLSAKGYKVLQAGTGKEGQHILEQERPDLLIVDGHLPDTDGADWIAERRADGINQPIVFISGFWRDPESYARLTDELGVELLVHKPVMPIAFSEQVDGLFHRRQVSAELPAPQSSTIEHALAALRAKYIEILPEKTAELVNYFTLAYERPEDSHLLQELKFCAHRLRGTAGSYGFLKYSENAATIEDTIVEIVKASRSPTQGEWVIFGACIKEIQNLCAEAVESQEQVPAAQEIQVAQPANINARILMVDDDPDFLKLIREIGRQRLVDIIPASSVAEAVECARTMDVDAAVIDSGLAAPETSEQCARELRSLPGRDTLPLAFISANGHVSNRIAAAHAGASLFLEKPIGPDALEAAVQHLVAIRKDSKPRVLVVDDDLSFIEQVSAILRYEGMTVESLSQSTRILHSLESFRPDVLLLDVMMPGISGYDVCRMLRTQPRWQDLPILFITSQSGWESRVATFQAGGDDYLSKPVIIEELLARVKVRVERARMIRERADKDSITGLLLRRSFMSELSARLSEALRDSSGVTLAMLDLDFFKKVNDTHGHLSGDGVLAGVGRLLLRRFRTEDLRGRWGGEEFILAFPGEDVATVSGALERALSEFKSIPFPGEDGKPFNVSFSAGLSSFPEDGASPYELIKNADRRLYIAKDTGRSKVVSKG
jgi:diguanylate cyclase (GGDEF)-like protein